MILIGRWKGSGFDDPSYRAWRIQVFSMGRADDPHRPMEELKFEILNDLSAGRDGQPYRMISPTEGSELRKIVTT